MPNLTASHDKRRDQRISLRATAEERDTIVRAASLAAGGDVTRFVMQASLDAARRTIEEYDTTELTRANRRAFYELVLINPPKPNAALRKLAAQPVPEGFELVED